MHFVPGGSNAHVLVFCGASVRHPSSPDLPGRLLVLQVLRLLLVHRGLERPKGCP